MIIIWLAGEKPLYTSMSGDKTQFVHSLQPLEQMNSQSYNW